MIKMVAFDFDGTVGDTIPMCIEAFKKSVSPYLGHDLTIQEIVQTFGLNETGMVKAVVKDNWRSALEDFYSFYEKMQIYKKLNEEGGFSYFFIDRNSVL
ncbi:HAD family hydrolase [Clostridium manihotivorum]|uniref:Uncharacterized protein n=1 Tax=Clostridium manihotivorum TaxID=2320868 RepID=A0A410DT24_9CLOT|nr:HAD hydrolase-like protein [Clostridium manihotivorum]QAA32158.1 hypothetical protein C1I91_11130 [Clostridium manihotivorum]